MLRHGRRKIEGKERKRETDKRIKCSDRYAHIDRQTGKKDRDRDKRIIWTDRHIDRQER